MARNYAALSHDYLEEMDILSDAEFGRLCRALLLYSRDGKEVQLEGAEKVLLKRVYMQERRFQESYDKQVNSKRDAGKKGAAKRWQIVADDGKAIFPITHDDKNGYTETNTETNTETKFKIEAYASCVEPETASTPLADSTTALPPPIILLPLNDGTNYPVSQEQCQEWAGLYPAVDVIQQLRNMRGWLDSKPSRRKTKRGIRTFITGWLAREQDRVGRYSRGGASDFGKKTFEEIAREMEANGEL